VRRSAHRVDIGRESIWTDVGGSKTSSSESCPSPGRVRKKSKCGPGGRLIVHTLRVQVPDNPTHYERMAGGGRRAAKISSNWDPYLKGEAATIPELSKSQVRAGTYDNYGTSPSWQTHSSSSSACGRMCCHRRSVSRRWKNELAPTTTSAPDPMHACI
jgi:hypothetical protein